MELRGRVRGETDAKLFTVFQNILIEHCDDTPEAYLFIEILKLSLEDKYRVVKSQIERHRIPKVKEADEWRECAERFIDSQYFDMYSFLSGVNYQYVRYLVKKIDRYFLIKEVQRNIRIKKLREVIKKAKTNHMLLQARKRQKRTLRKR